MKKYMLWLNIIIIVVLLIIWGVIGVKLFNGNYNFLIEAHISFICFIIIFLCSIYKILSSKCPYCGKLRITNGSYCSYCGKKID